VSPKQIRPGSIVWTDLTVENAPALVDFYQAVAGWQAEEVEVGDYHDYNMALAESGNLGPGERLCVIKDPAGAVAALIQQAPRA